ncbi:hypothetical protein CHLRE_09g405106v5 [Chlamydomonas reinhardtii]|uniref:Uncharacterized protein n=1 Tax=Chlamydomonas reinhardtii TaxID=3055 RepID=A0A2K3DCJ4_CHLRE|nr:uncharacterized protein CHLRE_09g405106v5 [Chlamydomonas reinhardtii]PNW78248.1 hypothetical protein CHLRE_09g405106v5 [Chlamydomonas reinhardtii]
MAVFTNTGPGRVAYFIPKSTQTQQSAEEVLGGRGGMPRRPPQLWELRRPVDSQASRVAAKRARGDPFTFGPEATIYHL